MRSEEVLIVGVEFLKLGAIQLGSFITQVVNVNKSTHLFTIAINCGMLEWTNRFLRTRY